MSYDWIRFVNISAIALRCLPVVVLLALACVDSFNFTYAPLNTK